MKTTKEPIKLRQRKLESGFTSLYLDIYVNGVRKYEYLKLYLIPENSRADKEHNRRQYALADTIRAQRLIDLRNKRYNLNDESVASPYLVDYFSIVLERRRNEYTEATQKLWDIVLTHLKAYIGERELTLDMVTTEWVEDFAKYLREEAKISINGTHTYIAKLGAMFREAMRDQLLMRNPIVGAELPKKEETHREFLTIAELRKLATTKCSNPLVKRMFLFACLTGLRYSDICALRWRDVREQGDFVRLVYKQQKTQKQEYLDITPQAVQYMGKRGEDDSKVFLTQIWLAMINKILLSWVKDAGIKKHISFHCSRHTFAVMMLDLGVDIYTVSKMLGHKDIKTTQIYAELLDKRKQEAVLKIPQI